MPENGMSGVYVGEVVRVRYNKGVPFIQAKVLAHSYEIEGTQYNQYTPWAPVCLPFAGANAEGMSQYGAWFSPRVGDRCVLAFERDLPGRPMCIGFLPQVQDMPVEFDNDDYTAKEREAEDRQEQPDDKIDKTVNLAMALRTPLLYILLHQLTNHLVLDAAKGDDAPEPRLEIGENATEVGFEISLGRRFVEQFLQHTHDCNCGESSEPTNIDYEEVEDYISEWAFITQKPREDGKTSPKVYDAVELEDMAADIAGFALDICKGITTANDFLDDPVGTLTDGIDTALDNAVAKLPDLDIEQVKKDANDFINNLGDEVADAGKGALSDWAGAEGALGGLIPGDASSALQGAIGNLDLGGVAGFAKDAFGSLMDMADSAGVTDAINNLSDKALGKALDKGVDQVKKVVNDTVTDAVTGVIGDAGLDIPFVSGALDVAAGICGGNLADTVTGLFDMAVDGINTLTGGALTPFTAGIKTVGAGLIDGAFQQASEDGQSQVENGRAE